MSGAGGSGLPDEKVAPVEFTGNDLDRLLKVHEAVFDLAETAEARVIVEVWSKADKGPVAWLEVHPADSEVRVTFSRPIHTEEAGRG